MLSNEDLTVELQTVAQQARDLADYVKSNGDLASRRLALSFVEASKIADRLTKLSKKLSDGNSRKK